MIANSYDRGAARWPHIMPLLAAIFVTTSLTSCIATYVLRPATGNEIGTAADKGLAINADGDAWRGIPEDLPQYITPIAVGVRNATGQRVGVHYADFSLLDEHGFRYAAINPFRTSRTSNQGGGAAGGDREGTTDKQNDRQKDVKEEPAGPGAVLDIAPRPAPTTAQPVLLASAGNPRLAYRAQRHTGSRVVVRPGRHFYVYPRHRYHFHHYAPWPGPIYYPPHFHTHVVLWGPAYYPARPPADVRRLGLPEGVLEPGGTVSGFLYFPGTHGRAKQLTLTWAARTPNGKSITTLRVPFVVLKR